MSGSALFFCLRCPAADSVHNSRVERSEIVSYTNYGLHTADVAATRLLLFMNYPRPRPRPSTASPLTRTGTCCNDERLPRVPELQLRRRSKSYARNCSFGSCSISFPPSRVKTLVFTSTQDLIRRRHESHKTIVELQSPTRVSWNRTSAPDGADCILVFVHASVLIDDDDIMTRIIIWKVVLPH